MEAPLRFAVLILCSLVFLAPGCTQNPPDTRAADEAAIRAADMAFSKAVEAKQLETAMAFFANDAIQMVPNAPMLDTRESIRKSFGGLLATPGIGLKFQPTKVEAARSGDFGYTVGTYEMTMSDAKGNPVIERGKYATFWKKQADGTWKAVVDISNGDGPPTPPSI